MHGESVTALGRGRTVPAAVALALASALATPAAPAAPAAPAQQAGGLEEIVVTARKTEERLQDVPLSVVALTAEQLERRQVRDLADVATLTPGLNFESYLGGSGTPVIRGAAQSRITDLDQNVSTFWDGIYLPRQYLVSPSALGLERVEVVKGPQSALYGRNAFMGAINYVTKKPGDALAWQVSGTLGGDDRRDVAGELSVPLVPAHVAVRLAAARTKFDGDVPNANPNAGARIAPGSPGRLGGWDDTVYQARLVLTPIDALELDLGFYRFELFHETPAIVRYQQSTGDTNCGATTRSGGRALYCGALDWRFHPLPGSAATGDVNVDPRGYGLDERSTLLRGHAEWRATDALRLVYEYGKIDARVTSGGSSDRDPVLGSLNIFAPRAPRGNQFQITPVGDLNYRSNEVRVEWRAAPGLDLMLGYFASRLNDYDYFPLSAGLPLLGIAPIDVNSQAFIVLSRGRTDVDAKAEFGRVNWQLTERVRVGVEARHSKETKALVTGPTTFSPAVATRSGDWSQTTPRATVDVRLSEASLLYVTAAKGAKSGGFNTSALVPAQFRFDPDENRTYEIGSKNTLLGGRLRLNGALFYVDWKNRQVSCSADGSPINITPPAVICNAGKATIKGLEVDAAWALFDTLSLTAGLSYNDAKYAGGAADQRLRDFRFCDDVVCARGGAIGGNQLERQSKVQAEFGFDWSVPLATGWGAFVGADVGYKSKQFADDVNLAYLPARTLANARFGVRGERWDVTGWVKNLTDERYAASAFAIFAATDAQYTPIEGPRRTWGVSARYSIGRGR